MNGLKFTPGQAGGTAAASDRYLGTDARERRSRVGGG
jgi:hypothetical protein